MERPHFRSFVIAFAAGMLTTELWLHRRLQAFSDAVERGDFDEAQRQVRLAYLSNFLVWLRKPPENDEG